MTARVALQDRISGYQDGGADIYLTKPTAPDELVLILMSLGRRVKKDLTSDEWSLNLRDRTLSGPHPGQKLRLTHREKTLLLALIFYIYAIIGIQLFGHGAPAQFGSLPAATLSLFQMITLDAWSDLFHVVNRFAPIASVLYFLSFILLGTMIMLNLFIGIILNGMTEMQAEADHQQRPDCLRVRLRIAPGIGH